MLRGEAQHTAIVFAAVFTIIYNNFMSAIIF